MVRKFRILIGVLAVATVILLLAAAYVTGYEEGVMSQEYTIKVLEEQRTGLIVDFAPYGHPLRGILSICSLIIAYCWLLVVIVALTRNKKPVG